MILERGTITRINTRGRITVQLADRRVEADLHSGCGGCVGDVIEGDMRLGVRSWRNVGNSILSVVQVVAIEPVPAPARASDDDANEDRRRRASDMTPFRADERWHITRQGDATGDQYSNRKLN
jgi:hypothetical protein